MDKKSPKNITFLQKISTFVPNKANLCVKMLRELKKVYTFLAKDLVVSGIFRKFAVAFGRVRPKAK